MPLLVTVGMSLRAREPRTAARSAALILAVCDVALAGLTVAQQARMSTAINAVSWVVVALVASGAVACCLLSPERLDRTGALIVPSLGGILLICFLNVLTHDASAAAQAFLAFPVLWASSHFRRDAVVLVTGSAVLGDGVTLYQLRTPAAATTDLVFFGAVLVVMAGTLLRSGNTQERLVAALQEQAAHDSLTGLVNRRVFDQTLEATLRSPVDAGTALVMIDVDSFKSVNDRHGHPVGDDLLVHLASVLRQQVRGEDALLSRLGGDELAVLLTGCTAEAAAVRAGQLLDAVRSTPLSLADGTLLSMSISVGVAHQPHSSGGMRALYAAADAALYEAKRAGRGRVVVSAA